MTPPDVCVLLTLAPQTSLTADLLQALYRITGRSTVELRRAAERGDALYTAELFGSAHVDQAPRLEKTIDLLGMHAIPFRLVERVGQDAEEISLDTLRAILGENDQPVV